MILVLQELIQSCNCKGTQLLVGNRPAFLRRFGRQRFNVLLHLLNDFNPLNAQLNPICHLLALLGDHHILHVSRIRVTGHCKPLNAKLNPICHLLALLGDHHILHVSRIRVNVLVKYVAQHLKTHPVYMLISNVFILFLLN